MGINYLEEAGVELLNCSRVVEFGRNLVRISRNVSAGVPDPYNTWQPILPKPCASGSTAISTRIVGFAGSLCRRIARMPPSTPKISPP